MLSEVCHTHGCRTLVLSIVVKSRAALAVRCGVLGAHRFSNEYLLPSSGKGLSEMAH